MLHIKRVRALFASAALLVSACATHLEHIPRANTVRAFDSAQEGPVPKPDSGELSERNDIVLFLGFAGDGQSGDNDGDGQNGDGDVTAGLDYERRFGLRWGVGGLAYVRDDSGLIGIPVYLHLPPSGRWALVAAPTMALGDQEGEFGVRFGVTYAFPVGAFSIKPSLYADLIGGEETFILGVGFGRAF